jgi:hypothetical protein
MQQLQFGARRRNHAALGCCLVLPDPVADLRDGIRPKRAQLVQEIKGEDEALLPVAI